MSDDNVKQWTYVDHQEVLTRVEKARLWRKRTWMRYLWVTVAYVLSMGLGMLLFSMHVLSPFGFSVWVFSLLALYLGVAFFWVVRR